MIENILVLPDAKREDFVPQRGRDFNHTILFDGKLLPVTKMFDSTGAPEKNPMNARCCTAYTGDYDFEDFTPGVLPEPGNWAIIQTYPGEIVVMRDYHEALASHRS